ncbi:hypothetical protein GF420_12075 [candidate division GN15 bacterium]|nr:hypothetical protein [candidate division GN15 bacterium]
MRRFVCTCMLLAICSTIALALPPATYDGPGQPGTDDALTVDNDTYIDANLILMFVTNHGNFGRDLADVFDYDYGTFYPYTSTADIISGANTSSPLFAAGLWLGGKVNGDHRVAVSEYTSEYVPGPMAGGTFQPDSPEFRVYRLHEDSLAGNPNEDYTTWPIDQGAPIEGGHPLTRGDQHVWTVFNDADPDQHQAFPGASEPLGVEARQSVWAEDAAGQQTIIRIQYDLHNKGGHTIDSFFISIWLDPDIGDAGDDLGGCDSANQMIFVYNGDNECTHYGATPPALGVKFEQGPMVPSPGDTAYYNGVPIPDYRNLGLYSANKYVNGTDPNDIMETYNYMRGLNADGSPRVDPTTAEVTRFMLRGDPIAGTGWIDDDPRDCRIMASYGPMTFAPGDSQQVVFTMAVGQGLERIASLIDVKNILESGSGGPDPQVTAADGAELEITDYRYLHDLWFAPSSERWLTGRFGQPLTAPGVGQMGYESWFGSSLNPETDPDAFTTVELRFSNHNVQNAYLYCRGNGHLYDYCGYYQVPFTAWDVENNRQLNVFFYENDSYASYWDQTWAPPPAGSYEPSDYLLIAESEYSGADPTNTPIDYTNLNLISDSLDVLYFGRFAIEAGHSMLDLADGQKLVFQPQVLNPNGAPDTVFFRDVEPGEMTQQEVTVSATSSGLSTLLFEVTGAGAFTIPLEKTIFTFSTSQEMPVSFAPASAGVYSGTLTVTDSVSGAVLEEVVLIGEAATAPLAAATTIEPDRILPIMNEDATIFLGDLQGGYTVNDIDQGTLQINGESMPVDVAVLGSHPDFTGEALEITVRRAHLIPTFPPIVGENPLPYTVAFATTDQQAFEAASVANVVGLQTGDLNGDLRVDLIDLTYLVNALYLGGPDPVVMEAANINCDEAGNIDLSDVVYMGNALFLGGPPIGPCDR